ncbi:MAG: stalk domain-containing protein [Lachnospiraceae bacterium]
MMKKSIRLFMITVLAAFTFYISILPVDAAPKTRITINQKAVTLIHKPIKVKKTVMLPAEEIFGKLGGSVEYFEADQLMLVTKQTRLCTVKAGKKTVSIADLTKNINKKAKLKQAPVVRKGVLYVPAEAVEKILGAKVKVTWTSKKHVIAIKSR